MLRHLIPFKLFESKSLNEEYLQNLFGGFEDFAVAFMPYNPSYYSLSFFGEPKLGSRHDDINDYLSQISEEYRNLKRITIKFYI
jgi:hypothetical protein